MYEQDIELTRLLLDKLQELDTQGEQLRSSIQQYQTELAETRQVREERESYLDVLSRAAQLLERVDLEVESPQISDLDQQIQELRLQLEGIDQEVLQYRKLVDELRERAPKLLEAATGQFAGASTDFSVEHSDADYAEQEEGVAEEPPFDQSAPEADLAPADEDDESEPHWSGDEEPTPAEEAAGAHPADEVQVASHAKFNRPTELDQLFDLKDLKVKEAFTFGLGAAYIVDATSVLDRVPHYDRHFLALHENEIRDALLSDLERLSREISGDFHVIFTTEHESAAIIGSHVKIEAAGGDGTKGQADTRIVQLVAEITGQERTACVVTGDAVLAENVSGDGVYVIPLGNFFKT